MRFQNLVSGCLGAIFLFATLAAAPPAAAQEGGILIVQSFYGGSRGCDPTAAVARSCAGKASCSIAASNALCGDPEPGVVKRLRVVFRCGRQGGDQDGGSHARVGQPSEDHGVPSAVRGRVVGKHVDNHQACEDPGGSLGKRTS